MIFDFVHVIQQECTLNQVRVAFNKFACYLSPQQQYQIPMVYFPGDRR